MNLNKMIPFPLRGEMIETQWDPLVYTNQCFSDDNITKSNVIIGFNECVRLYPRAFPYRTRLLLHIIFRPA